MIAKRTIGFSTSPLYKRKESHALHYFSERVTFWVAVLSVFAFVTGNMVGQHGWYVFWRSVMGESDLAIEFTGTVSPLAQIPDPKKWSQYGGSARVNTFRQAPADVLVPLPKYESGRPDSLKNIYFVDNLGRYDTGAGQGSHPGIDIATPEGTPVQAIANGIVTRSAFDAGGYGNYIVIKHPKVPDPEVPGALTTLYSVYAHLSSAIVKEGDVVNKAEIIGATGSTGFATGPHLHFQLDRDSAPWHPFWPFTSSEARDAGMTMTEAVNAGLHRERGLENTVNPMVFVQAYQSGAPQTIVKAATPVKTGVKTTVASRREARMAKLGITSVMTVAIVEHPAAPEPTLEPAPVQQPMVSTQSSSAAPVSTPVTTVEFRHPEFFSAHREWLKVEVILKDADGNIVTKPTLDRPVAFRTVFGKAEFRPAQLTAADFRGGKATIELLPISETTIVLQAMPLGSQSEPLRYQRGGVATR